MSGSVFPSALKVISNPIRRAMIQLLSKEKMTYVELLSSIGLDIDRHRGWFNYHLEVLLNEGIMSKEGDQYVLTEFGKNTATLLDAIERESHRLFVREVTQLDKKAMTEKAPRITIGRTQFGEYNARLLEERDVPSIAEALFTEEFYSRYSEYVTNRLIQTAKKGLDRYTNTIVVERDGKAVSRAIIDHVYQPYAEVSIGPIHPKYTGQEEDIWTELIEGSISLAKQFNCNIIYTMEFKNSPSAEPFYEKYGATAQRVFSKFGFHPAMIQGFTDKEYEICLFRFSDTPCYQHFMNKHPLSILSISGGKIDFHGNHVYQMKWCDPQTKDFLCFLLKGKRHESMPRIVGVARKEGSLNINAWTEEVSPDITQEKSGRFNLCLENTGKDKVKTQIDFILPEELTINGELRKTISSELEKEACWELNVEVKPDFDVPVLSFWTVLVTCQIQLDNLTSALPISAGFELDRPPMKKSS